MSVLDQLASALGRRDEAPNQELARKLVAAAEIGDVGADIALLVEGLGAKDKAIRHDCIKVLYEVGYERPELIAEYVVDFAALLPGRDNRMVWGAMTALGAIAPLRPASLWPHVETILETTRNGSVITQDWGVRVLAALAAADPDYAKTTWPFLLGFLKACRPKDVARHAESVQVAATTTAARHELSGLLEHRLPDLKPASAKRVNKVLENLS